MTPQQRLAASRRAIVQSMLRDSGGQDGESPEGADDDAAVSGRPSPRQGPFDEAFAQATSGNRHGDLQGAKRLWRRLRRTAAAWWRTHPAHLALEVVQPMVGRYAQAHPVKLLTVAAALGAAVVVARPWRLVSLTGVLIAALRSTQVSGLVASLLTPRAEAPAPGEPLH